MAGVILTNHHRGFVFKKILQLALIFSIFGCSDTEQWEPRIERMVADAPTEAQALSFSRGACYGTCPVYDFYIFPDDNFVFIGRAHVKKMGAYRGTLEKGTFQSLVNLVDNNNFLKLSRTGYFGNSHSADATFKCGLYKTDHPSVSIGVQVQESKLTVTHNLGCSDFPDEQVIVKMFSKFEQVVILNSKGLI
ncbi:DUF6438 domain-containing protein [Rheinheimera sp.]|uniref:DUF6438 domain-containing protein n=1 Tax=Rheinheimera sp. TaxID=1869214 RepID=UPI0027344880|nr:DUF6438 domain-containing protein [Rheinheimera sp.]